jgi:inward rectifier potassium channel
MKIYRSGVREKPLVDFYHRMMRISWGLFFVYIFVAFFLFNCFFAMAYELFTPIGIANLPSQNFWNYFFFSVQTAASIGFGHFHPESYGANILVSVEAFGGLLMNALITGLVFSRFSRPAARIIFSQNLIWVNYFGKTALMLRLGNARTNRIFSGRATWVYLHDEVTPEGDSFRRMLDLKLVRSETSVFALSWTLIHIIDEKSPLNGLTFEKLQSSDDEFMLTFSGLDEETSQMLSTHAMYWARDVVRAKKYVDMIVLKDQGVREIDFGKIDQIEV